MKIAFLSPYTNTTNEYIETQKRILSAAGFTTQPLNLKQIFSRNVFKILNKENILIYHWIENRALKKTTTGLKFTPIGFLQWLLYALINTITNAKVIYFIHNHAVHDSTGLKRHISSALIRIFSKTASIRVVHDESFKNTYNAEYIPHPLAWEANPPPIKKHTGKVRQPTFGILGAIRPYKKIEDVLAIWPEDARLLIRGKGDPAYVEQLQSLIKARNLTQVDLKSAFLDKNDFNELISELDAIIFAHESGSMLVSGAFFEAIGIVPIIIARKTPFFEVVSKRFTSMRLFSESNGLKEIIENNIQIDQSNNYRNRELAIEEFGFLKCVSTFKEITKR